MLSQSDAHLLASIREDTRVILRNVTTGRRDVALLDVPNQRNVGDSLIWAGERAYLNDLGISLRYECDLRSYNPRSIRTLLPPDGIVLIHGGGNFGDLWQGHQTLRERIIEDLPDYKIIQLPQSIYFRDSEKARQANKILSRHQDLTILLRDTLSLERIADQLPDVKAGFCYDMAFGWSPRRGLGSPTASAALLVIARNDIERTSGLLSLSPTAIPGVSLEITDWIGRDDPAMWRVARFGMKGFHTLPFLQGRIGQSSLRKLLSTINLINIDTGTALYADKRGAIVDRLHAHILAALLGIPHVVMDNNYQKIKAVYGDYSGRFSTAAFATSIEEALAVASSFKSSDEV